MQAVVTSAKNQICTRYLMLTLCQLYNGTLTYQGVDTILALTTKSDTKHHSFSTVLSNL